MAAPPLDRAATIHDHQDPGHLLNSGMDYGRKRTGKRNFNKFYSLHPLCPYMCRSGQAKKARTDSPPTCLGETTAVKTCCVAANLSSGCFPPQSTGPRDLTRTAGLPPGDRGRHSCVTGQRGDSGFDVGGEDFPSAP
ncbi:unnamed protein product [Pleuronectes platessa]|uniref:Uncharacterized protein n=1 Tax=Pleuronectes platessa TaxID=8262 RepID=A0A9N7TW90_PLEPL|nr:unnamed protein product [Pleuronectes platessa]